MFRDAPQIERMRRVEKGSRTLLRGVLSIEVKVVRERLTVFRYDEDEECHLEDNQNLQRCDGRHHREVFCGFMKA